MRMSFSKISLLCAALFTALFSLGVRSEEGNTSASDNATPYYRVLDGKVDARTFMGWRVFHMNCHSCHGIDAVGTDVAPSLVEMVKLMGPDTFAVKVLKRYRITVGMNEASAETGSAARNAIIDEMLRQQRGQEGELVMPGWEEFNPGIRAHILDLYAYLKARADGALKPGRPELIKE